MTLIEIAVVDESIVPVPGLVRSDMSGGRMRKVGGDCGLLAVGSPAFWRQVHPWHM